MLTLNKELLAITRRNGDIEYDYDGPMLADLNDRKWIDSCLKYMKEKNPITDARIVRVKLVELTD
jgi:hypothetical protein